MNKFCLALIFYFISANLFSQNIEELKSFIQMESKNYELAVKSFEKLLVKSKKNDYYKILLEANIKLNNLEDALKYYNILEQNHVKDITKYKVLIYAKMGNVKKLEEALQKNMRSAYKIKLYDLLNKEDYFILNHWNLIDKILKNSYYSTTEKQIYQVEKLYQQEKYTDALYILNKIINEENNQDEAYYLLSKVENKLENNKNALQSINKALEIKSQNTGYLSFRSCLYSELHDYEKALEDIEKIIKLNPLKVDNYILKADLLLKNKNYPNASELSEKLLEILPFNTDILYINSKSYYHQDKYFEALKQVNQLMEIKSEKKYFELRADIYLATNTYQYAIYDYSMFLDIEPYNGEIYTRKGFARFKNGDTKGACSDWVKAKRYGSYDAVKYYEKHCK